MASAYFRLLIGIQLKFAYFSLNQFQLHNQHHHHHHHHHFLVVNLILLGKLYCGQKFFCFSPVLIDFYDAGNCVTQLTDRMNSFRINIFGVNRTI